MSLLMDALKRAETNKQEAARANLGKEAASGQTENQLSLEPIADAGIKPPGKPLPELAAHLEAVDADLASNALRPPPQSPPAARPVSNHDLNEREAVRNAFAAKQSAVPPTRKPLWLLLGALGIGGLGIAAYFAYQLMAMNSSSLTAGTQPAAQVARSNPQPVPAIPVNPPPVFALPEPSTAAIENEPESGPPLSPQQTSSRPVPAPPAPDDDAPRPASSIQIRHKPPQPDQDLLRGQASLRRNDLAEANAEFARSLQRDPNNIDALLALAAIAGHQGRQADMLQLQQRALLADPSNPAVQAAILGSAAKTDPQLAESRLHSLLSNNPESGPLNFALGNLYARQARWSEAQQAYFNAVSAENDNPDYLFNLAVSLDHLRQSRLAGQHYRLALEAATKRPAAFNAEAVRKRLTELQP